MKRFIQGFIIGAVLASVLTAWAASRMVLVDGDDVAVGTAANPLYIQSV